LTLAFSFEPEQRTGRAFCQLTLAITADGVELPAGQRKVLTIWYGAGEAACELEPGATIEFKAVEEWGSSDSVLTIKNATSHPGRGVDFEYQLATLSGQCDAFLYENWVDSIGGLEPGEEKNIRFSFTPRSEGTFECVKSLYTVQRDALPPSPCPSPVVFRGTGLPGPRPVCAVQPADTLDYGEITVGASADRAFTLLNQTSGDFPTNRFRFLFDDPAGDCGLFPLDPADAEGVIGPGGSREIAVRFTPNGVRTFQCTRSLSSLKEPADPTDPFIASPCPTQIVWKGTGVGSSLQWSPCLPGDTQDRFALFPTPEGQVFAVGEEGSVLVSDGDCQWEAAGTGLASIAHVNLEGLWVHGTGTEQVIWAAGTIPPPAGTYLRTGAIVRQDGGEWAVVDHGTLEAYSAVWGSGPNDVYFGGTGISTDFPNAKHWDGTQLTGLTISDLGMSTVSGMSGTASDDVWAVLRQGFFSVYRYQGSAWEDQTQPFMTQPLDDVWVTQGTDFYALYAVGAHGAIYRHHDDGGTPTWTDESIPGETRDFHAVWVGPSGQGFVVGEDLVTRRGHVAEPGEWVQISPPEGVSTDSDLLDVWGAADGDVYAVGTMGVIIRIEAPGG